MRIFLSLAVLTGFALGFGGVGLAATAPCPNEVVVTSIQVGSGRFETADRCVPTSALGSQGTIVSCMRDCYAALSAESSNAYDCAFAARPEQVDRVTRSIPQVRGANGQCMPVAGDLSDRATRAPIAALPGVEPIVLRSVEPIRAQPIGESPAFQNSPRFEPAAARMPAMEPRAGAGVQHASGAGGGSSRPIPHRA
ncbi:MAG TPA: hypothetical protein VIG32_06760 [Candidatus Baltobacteraceae bacterium]|jgi:hypothetical protein